ncbi:MAG: hypothetical protein ND866_18375 [Pyrinomonadaceae bacterium]|nr:hypothetical protein [Pyrinomonadaceae bacterium]
MNTLHEGSQAVNFLDQFEPARRSGVAQLFYIAVREGAATPSSVIESVRAAIRRKAGLASLLDTPEALAFAQYCIERESLPPEEKAALKVENRKRYQREYLKAQKPTIKQLNYLRNLGCLVVPQNMLEASELIDTWTTRVAVWP